jgi:DNA-binding NtrC family response regulator
MSERKSSQGGSPSNSPEEREKHIRLLLIDDEEGFVTVLSNRLKKRGIDVRIAISGSKAIQTLRRQDFNVAVLDLKMEDMDGIDVLKIFKKMVPEMPVIMLTGHGSEQAAREGIEYGAFDYLTKPCDIEELVEKIRDAVQQGR